jgi:6-phospho-beta-glucosidase
LQEQQEWPPSRGEIVTRIERDLLAAYAEPASVQPPAELLMRGGAFYSTLATRLIRSHKNNLGEVEIVNTYNRGTIKDLPSDWILEMPCTIDRQGFHPLPADPLPEACRDLVMKVKAYELFTVEAAVHGDRQAALHALQAHPLGPAAENAPAVLEDILTTHQQYLPQFFEENGFRTDQVLR